MFPFLDETTNTETCEIFSKCDFDMLFLNTHHKKYNMRQVLFCGCGLTDLMSVNHFNDSLEIISAQSLATFLHGIEFDSALWSVNELSGNLDSCKGDKF